MAITDPDYLKRVWENIQRATGAVIQNGVVVKAANVNLGDHSPAAEAKVRENIAAYDAAKASAASAFGTAVTVASAGTVTTQEKGGADRAARQAQMDKFTGWDNNPDVRALQIRDWEIFVDTGRWDTPEQQELHQQAEMIRKYLNPTYKGSPAGPTNWMEADQIFPRDTTPNADSIEGGIDSALNVSNWGKYLSAGVGLVFLFMIMSMFRRR